MISQARAVTIVFSLVHCCTAEPLKDKCIDGSCKGQSATASTLLQLQSNKNKQLANVEQQLELVIAKRIAARIANQTKLSITSASKRQTQKKEKMKKTQSHKRALAAISRKHRQSIQEGKRSRRLPKTLVQAATKKEKGNGKPIDECSSCDMGCMVAGGMCYHEDPLGNPATEILCSEYGGTWCGASDGSDGGTLPPVTSTVCASEGDFMPDRMMHGWCDMYNVPTSPTRDQCWNEGCSPYDQGEGEIYCWCEEKGPCEALGGVFEGPTCQQEMRYWQLEAMGAVADTGTCDNVSTEWGEPIADAMWWMAQQCCGNYPATLCDPEARAKSPCKDERDFEPDAFIHGWCEYHTVPEREPCMEAGCSFWEDESYDSSGYRSCHCETLTQCTSVGGRYKGYTCAEQMSESRRQTDLLRQAAEQGTCDGLELSWGDTLEYWVRHQATKCCKSSPANACDPNARLMTPCKDDRDFDGEAELHGWCEMGTQPTQEMCEDARCFYWSNEGQTGCHCDHEAGCKQVSGTYKRETCADSVQNWDGNIHALLQEAQEAGTCESRSFDWGQSLPDFLRWPAEKCCKSYPATLCEPDAKTMHPCIGDDDFEPEAIIHEWCDYGSKVEPAQETCEDAGYCHCHKPDACAHFGGQPSSETCETDARHKEDIRQLLKEAQDKGNCEDLATPWGSPLADEIRHTARKCCTSYPATICGEFENQ